MKTTFDIPDPLFRQLKVQTVLKGITMKSFVLEAIQDKLREENSAKSQKESGWRVVFGKAKGSTEEVQTIIDQEFSSIDLEEWK